MNACDREYMKMAMLKHEETFRNQVNELHRLYRTQKMLMKDVAQKHQIWIKESSSANDAGEIRSLLKVEEDDENYETELELTLGPKSYYPKKITAAANSHEPNAAQATDLRLPSFCSSSSSSSSHGLYSHVVRKRTRNSTGDELISSRKKWAGLELIGESDQEFRLQNRIPDPHWHFQLLSLNMA